MFGNFLEDTIEEVLFKFLFLCHVFKESSNYCLMWNLILSVNAKHGLKYLQHKPSGNRQAALQSQRSKGQATLHIAHPEQEHIWDISRGITPSMEKALESGRKSGGTGV